MQKVSISLNFPEGFNAESFPAFEFTAVTGVPAIGDFFELPDAGKRLVVSSRAWVYSQGEAQLIIDLEHFSD